MISDLWLGSREYSIHYAWLFQPVTPHHPNCRFQVTEFVSRAFAVANTAYEQQGSYHKFCWFGCFLIRFEMVSQVIFVSWFCFWYTVSHILHVWYWAPFGWCLGILINLPAPWGIWVYRCALRFLRSKFKSVRCNFCRTGVSTYKDGIRCKFLCLSFGQWIGEKFHLFSLTQRIYKAVNTRLMSQPLKVIFIPIHPFSLISHPVRVPRLCIRQGHKNLIVHLRWDQGWTWLKMEDLPWWFPWEFHGFIIGYPAW